MIKDTSFYCVNGWMMNQLGLTGVDLLCFAIIFSLSQNGEGRYIAGLRYLSEFMQCSQPTASKALKNLLEKGLIEKEEIITESGRRVFYFCNMDVVEEMKNNPDGGTKESLEGVHKKFIDGVYKKFIPKDNNNIINPNNSLNNKNKENNILSAKEDFEDFYKLYPLKKSKQSALKAWNKLSEKDKQAAKDKLLAYIDDCMRNKRSFKYPATYLNQRTWEDDFGTAQKIAFYDALESDGEEKKRFKAWMRKTHPEIENTALPLSYEDYMQFYEEYGTCAIDAALAYIEKDIYMYRKVDIAQVLKSVLTEED